MILLWVAIGVGIYYLLKNNGKIEFRGQNRNNAVDELRFRYAKGEINDEEYERMYKIIIS